MSRIALLVITLTTVTAGAALAGGHAPFDLQDPSLSNAQEPVTTTDPTPEDTTSSANADRAGPQTASMALARPTDDAGDGSGDASGADPSSTEGDSGDDPLQTSDSTEDSSTGSESATGTSRAPEGDSDGTSETAEPTTESAAATDRSEPTTADAADGSTETAEPQTTAEPEASGQTTPSESSQPSGTRLFEVIATDAGETLAYEFAVDGTTSKAVVDDWIRAGDNDEIVDGDGTTTVRGFTGNGYGDAYDVDGEIVEFERIDGDSNVSLRLDGTEVDPASFGSDAGPSEDGAHQSDDEPGSSDGETGPSEGESDPQGSAPSPDEPTQVDSCTVISSPGTYELTADVVDSSATTCIEIDASDVVFDGGGHRVDGIDERETVGVLVRIGEAPVRNVTVRDVVVRDWDDGLRADTSGDPVSDGPFRDARFERVTATSNLDTGVGFEAAENVTVAESTIRGNGGTGVSHYYYRANNSVVDTTIADNGGSGVRAFEGGHNVEIRSSVITANARDGVRLQNEADRPLIVDNAITENGGAGVVVSIGSAATIAGNGVASNGGAGIVTSDSSDDRIVDNAVIDNGDGILLSSASDTVVRNNSATDNAAHGIALVSADDNTVVGNVACDNAADRQILVDDESTGNAVSDNTVVCGEG